MNSLKNYNCGLGPPVLNYNAGIACSPRNGKIGCSNPAIHFCLFNFLQIMDILPLVIEEKHGYSYSRKYINSTAATKIPVI